MYGRKAPRAGRRLWTAALCLLAIPFLAVYAGLYALAHGREQTKLLLTRMDML